MSANKRTFITAAGLLIFVFAYNYWAYTFSHIPVRYSKLIRDYTMLFGIVFFLFDGYFGMITFFQQEIHKVMIGAVITINIMFILINHDIIADVFKSVFYAFNSGIIIATLTILTVAIRNGHFKNG